MDLSRSVLEARERGDFLQAAAICQQARAAATLNGDLCLQCLRASMSSGSLIDAYEWMEIGLAATRDPAALAIFRLEGAQIELVSRLDFAKALRVAETAAHATDELRPEDAAEVRWLALRLRVAAATHRELPADQAREIDAELTKVARDLLAAGRVHAGLSAAFLHADRKVVADESLVAFEALVELASTHRQFDVAGDAALRRAEQLRRAGASDDVVLAEIHRARQLYGSIDHVHGPVDCTRAEAGLAIDRHASELDELESCVDAYLSLGFVRGAVSTLMDVSTHAHRRGDAVAAERHGMRLRELARRAGMGMEELTGAMRQADLAMRHGLYSKAIDWCESALALQPPRVYRACILVLRSSARAMVGDHRGTGMDLQQALAIYDELEAEDHASIYIPSLAMAMAGSHAADGVAQADELLRGWISRDRANGRTAGVVAKIQARVDLQVRRAKELLARSDSPQAQTAALRLLEEAQQLLEEAHRLADSSLVDTVKAQCLGNLAQRRAIVAAMRNDEQVYHDALQEALLHLEQSGNRFEAANTRYLLGCHFLNKTNRAHGPAKLESFGQAEEMLIKALRFYEGAGQMRRYGANTKHKLALLWLNVQHLVAATARQQMLETASEFLVSAAADIDTLRWAYRTSDALEAYGGKANLVQVAVQLTEQALRLHLLLEPNMPAAWSWVTRSKSRALNDLIGTDGEMPLGLEAALSGTPELTGMVVEERELTQRLAEAVASDRRLLIEAIDGVHNRMRAVPALQEYVELRTGGVAGERDLEAALDGVQEQAAFVDWVALGERLWVFVARPGGQPVAELLPLSTSTVRRIVEDLLSPETFRQTLHRDPQTLDALAPLVAPLAYLTMPGEHLVLCPTGPLHAIPLHALICGSASLWARNPLAYTPSLSVLRRCRQRADATGCREAVVFGDPSGDRSAALSFTHRVAKVLGARELVGKEASIEALEQALANAAVVHFQGHARHEHSDPLASHLVLAGGARMQARRLFELPRIRTRMVVLGACESAASVCAAGDELLGLIPALLTAGARTIVAAQWPVQDVSAARLMSAFYAGLVTGETPCHALRAAALELGADPAFATPYHWAPFALYGDPWRSLQAREVRQ